MFTFDPHDWDRHYQRGIAVAGRESRRIVERFRQSCETWLHGALNWPEDDWEADLRRFIQHSQSAGIRIEPESQDQLRALLEARVRGTGVFALLHEQEPPRVLMQLAAAPGTTGTASDAEVNLSEPPDGTYVNGIEVAGPGPETTQSYKNKVRLALEILDPAAAKWWHANSVDGLIRSRKAWWPFKVTSYVENDRPIIVVDQYFTPGQTAQAIIDETASGLFATSIGVYFRRYKIARSQSEKEFQAWRAQALQEAAAYASTLAEIYISSLASLTPAGELIVTVSEVAEDGFAWHHVLSALPFLDRLPAVISAVTLKFKGGKKLVIDGPLLKEIRALSKADREIIGHAVKSSKTPEEALGKIKGELSKRSARTTGTKNASKKRPAPKGDDDNNVDVYISPGSYKQIQYAGITSDFARRSVEQLHAKGIVIEKLMSSLSRRDARAVEQALIEIHGLQKNGGTLINKINSISKRNPEYAERLKRGLELLKSIGYKE